jgi:sulfhydrogenase subunit gamma (sulfur reductase)
MLLAASSRRRSRTAADKGHPMENIYQPYVMTLQEITQETSDIKTFKLTPRNGEQSDAAHKLPFEFQAGQFGLFSVFGKGEAPFGIANSPTRARTQGVRPYIECSVKRVGKVTDALHDLNVGDVVGFRGPYGNSFPIESMVSKNLVFVGGGIGMAPLRSLLWNCIDRRSEFGDITVVYGARSVGDLVYKQELQEWVEMPDIDTVLTVDPGGEDESWEGEIGFVPTVLEKVHPSPENTVVITCGPPIMIRFVLVSLANMKYDPEQIITTLEMKMKCGLGKCGRCNIGPAYVCKHGPVFSFAELKELPDEY